MSFSQDWSDAVWRPEEGPSGPRSNPFLLALAWLVIVAAAVLIVVGRQVAKDNEAPPQSLDRSQVVLQELLGRYIVGAKEGFGLGAEELEKATRGFPVSADDRASQLCLAILEGEVRGPAAALTVLNAIEPNNDDVAWARELLVRLYRDVDAERRDLPALSQAERDWLRRKLGWFADLALHPPPLVPRLAPAIGAAAALAHGANLPDAGRADVVAPAVDTLMVLVIGFGGMALLAAAGFVGLIVVIVLVRQGRLLAGMGAAAPYHGLYAETFALWLVVYLGGSVLLQAADLGLDALEVAGGAMIGSLAVLCWPRLRGVPWERLRADIGLTAGVWPAAEPIYGIACYALALPLVAVGMMLYVTLAGQLGGLGLIAADAPTHPLLDYLTRDDAFTRLKVYAVACIVAPIVEEVMFRGVFYRHLRDLTRELGGGWSFVIAGFVVSFIFAIIHPQGLLFAPVLMGLALGMTIAREWRGSLVAPITLHALSNGIMITIMIRALG